MIDTQSKCQTTGSKIKLLQYNIVTISNGYCPDTAIHKQNFIKRKTACLH